MMCRKTELTARVFFQDYFICSVRWDWNLLHIILKGRLYILFFNCSSLMSPNTVKYVEPFSFLATKPIFYLNLGLFFLLIPFFSLESGITRLHRMIDIQIRYGSEPDVGDWWYNRRKYLIRYYHANLCKSFFTSFSGKQLEKIKWRSTYFSS